MKKKTKSRLPPVPSSPAPSWFSPGGHGWAAVIFLALAAVFFSESLFLGKVTALRDVASQFYPPRWFFRETLLSGELPFWCARMFGGYPFHANPQNAVFYPLTLLFVIFPPDYAVGVYIALHCAMLGFFTYLFVRSLGVSFAAAVFAGLVPAFAGLPLKTAEFLELLGSLAWMPLAFYFFRMMLREGGWRPAIALAGTLAVQFLAGSPYPTFYTLIGLAGYGGFQLILARRGVFVWKNARWLPLGLAGVLFLGLIAVQLLPTAALARQMPPEALKTILPPVFSFRLIDGLNFVMPYFFGYPDWQKCVYAGLLPLLLVPFAVMAAVRRDGGLERSAKAEVGFFSGLILLSLVLAMGAHLGLDRLLAHLPVVSRFYKWPTLSLSLGLFGLAVLAGIGFDVLRKAKANGAVHTLLFLLLTAGGVILLAVLGDAIFSHQGSEALRGRFFENVLGLRSEAAQPVHYPLGSVLIRFAGVLAVSLAALAFVILRPALRVAGLGALFAVLVADQFLFGFGLNFASPVNIYRARGKTAEGVLKKEDNPESFRIYSPPWIGGLNDSTYGSRQPKDFLLLKELWADTTFLPTGLNGFHGGGVLRLPEFEYVVSPWLEALPADQKSRVLGRSSVKYEIEAAIEDGSLRYALKENLWFHPRVSLVPGIRAASDWPEVFATLTSPDFDPEKEVMVQAKVMERTSADFTGTIKEAEFRTNRVSVKYLATAPGYLVLTDTYSPDWRAEVDGQAVEVLKANLLQRAVAVPAGEHVVTFRYSSAPLKAGLMVSVVALIAAIIGWFCAPRGVIPGRISR